VTKIGGLHLRGSKTAKREGEGGPGKGKKSRTLLAHSPSNKRRQRPVDTLLLAPGKVHAGKFLLEACRSSVWTGERTLQKETSASGKNWPKGQRFKNSFHAAIKTQPETVKAQGKNAGGYRRSEKEGKD